jgi:hypothetical protein
MLPQDAMAIRHWNLYGLRGAYKNLQKCGVCGKKFTKKPMKIRRLVQGFQKGVESCQ